jgi:hypothetical protein
VFDVEKRKKNIKKASARTESSKEQAVAFLSKKKEPSRVDSAESRVSRVSGRRVVASAGTYVDVKVRNVREVGVVSRAEQVRGLDVLRVEGCACENGGRYG